MVLSIFIFTMYKSMNNRMSWEEIKQKYPHQYVGLIDVKYGVNNATIDSAVVKYTDSDLSYDELIALYLKGEILLRYTTLDEDEIVFSTYILFNKIELEISKDDLDYLYEKRFFTNTPTLEDIQSEFVTGTGITPNKAHLMSLSKREETGKWKDASKRFHEYVDNLRAIEK